MMMSNFFFQVPIIILEFMVPITTEQWATTISISLSLSFINSPSASISSVEWTSESKETEKNTRIYGRLCLIMLLLAITITISRAEKPEIRTPDRPEVLSFKLETKILLETGIKRKCDLIVGLRSFYWTYFHTVLSREFSIAVSFYSCWSY